MRIFITGASGWIGSSVVPELTANGHQVVALARSDASATALTDAGAEIVRGDLGDIEILQQAARDSDGVIHLAYDHSLGQVGAAPTDEAAIDAFITALAGTDKPLLITGATLTHPGGVATERDPLVPAGPIAARIVNMQKALAAVDQGIRVSLVMIPRSVHGDGERHGFIPQLVSRARETGVSGYVGEGTNRWPAVHVKDAASLYRLAIEKAPAGSVLYAVGDEGVVVRDVAEAIATSLNMPAKSLPAQEFGMPLGALLSADMPASSAITQELLGWTPTHVGLIEDIEQGHYFA
jgi:nucleoside-diphosphate-sugar epimerase